LTTGRETTVIEVPVDDKVTCEPVGCAVTDVNAPFVVPETLKNEKLAPWVICLRAASENTWAIKWATTRTAIRR
jgi:hypothetical protein